jgi:RND family efflux transporter MFP subunit
MAERRNSFLIFYVFLFVGVAVAAGAVYWFYKGKEERLAEEAKARSAQVDKGPLVATAVTTRGPDFRRVNLIGEALPYKSATLYGKVSGYLTRIAVDTGDRVRAGQFIAEVTSPELDAQYRSAQASLENRQRLLDRTRNLAEKGFFSQQALDNAETDVKTQGDQVREIKTMQSYRTLTAPFDGMVTARYADVGTLVTNATSNRSSAQPVVTISDTSRLRVTVYVDQQDAGFIKPGTQVEISDASNAEIKGKATVSRVTGQLDPRTRTMMAEVDVDNAKGTFIPGSFVTVSLLIPARSYVEAPAGALVTREGKTFVPVLDAENKVKLTPIEVAGTDGKVIRIANGVETGVKLALNLPNTVSDGSRVNPAPAPAPVAAAPASAPASVSASAAPGSPSPGGQQAGGGAPKSAQQAGSGALKPVQQPGAAAPAR